MTNEKMYLKTLAVMRNRMSLVLEDPEPVQNKNISFENLNEKLYLN